MPATDARRIDRLVIDTNVIVSAALVPFGASSRLFDQVLESKVILICAETIAELRAVLGYDRITMRLSHARIDALLALVTGAGERVAITGSRAVVADDPDDDKFIELAEVGRAHCLVTADGDLLRLRPVGVDVGKTWENVSWGSSVGPLPIMRPSELLKAFELGEAT